MRSSSDVVAFNTLSYFVVGLLALLCLAPFLFLVSGSLTSEGSIYHDGYRLVPKVISLEAYRIVFEAPERMARAYLVTTLRTVAGTVAGLFITAMTGYALVRLSPRLAGLFSFYFYFTTLFSGGLIPFYILVVRYLQLKDTFLSLLLPMLLSAWNIFLMRSFMKGIPESIVESAVMDGATETRAFLSLVIPLSAPSLATIGLFIALGHWNDWFLAMLFVESPALYPLQYFLYRLLSSRQFIASVVPASVPVPETPTESLTMALAVVATGPVILLYPFAQRYFVKGLVVGAIKD